jgi:hypothetical protein
MIDPSGVLKQDLKGYGLDVPRIFILNPKRTTASSISNAVSFDQFRPCMGSAARTYQRRAKKCSDERQP